MRDQIIDLFNKKWQRANQSTRKAVVDFLIKTYDRFICEGLGDKHFEKELLSNDIGKYDQRLSEILLAEWLWRSGFSLESGNEGPDFKARKNGVVIWLELITPCPCSQNGNINDITKEDLYIPSSKDEYICRTEPHEKRCLKWASSIKNKYDKLNGYLDSGLVNPKDPYIIVVNPRMLSPLHLDMKGISGLPYPVEICFGIGPYQINYRDGSINNQDRRHIKKNKSLVPSNIFLDYTYTNLTAIIGIDLADRHLPIFCDEYNSVMVYNPWEKDKIPNFLFSTQEHWKCEMINDDFEIFRIYPKCWICGVDNPTTREHKIKSSDLSSLYGKPTQENPLYLHKNMHLNKRVGSLDSDILKYKHHICKNCNNSMTQPYDLAWAQYSEFIRFKSPSSRPKDVIRFNRIFPYKTKLHMLRVHLYFVKLFGCQIIDNNIPIDIEPFSSALVEAKPHEDLYISFGKSLGFPQCYAEISDIHLEKLNGKVAFASLLYRIGDLSVMVMYAQKGEKRQGLEHAWHPNGSLKRIIYQKF